MTIVRQKIPVCMMFMILCTKLKVRFYRENEEFLPSFSFRWFSNFFTSGLLPYFAKETTLRTFFAIFFYLNADGNEWPVRVFIGNHLFLGGQEVKVTVFRTTQIVWLWFWVDRRQVKSNWGWCENWILHSLSWTDRSPIQPKLKSKLGVECRKTLDSTARPRRQMLFA